LNAIELYARRTLGHDERVAHAVAALQAAADEHPGAIVQATSLGAEDMVITDLIARHQLQITVATLETGRLHEETLALLPTIHSRYGLEVEVWRPVAEAVVHFVRSHGDDPMYRSIELRKACCGIRKLEPLARMLTGRSAWITGLRREQSDGRGGVPFHQVDENGRTKFNPLADWSLADVWHYIDAYDVPYNALHDRFYPSIGCEPCTRPVAVGEDFRAGRWWWESEAAKECGLHVDRAAASSSLVTTPA
jgi:phosphoadenosine phosphosulfate reductase